MRPLREVAEKIMGFLKNIKISPWFEESVIKYNKKNKYKLTDKDKKGLVKAIMLAKRRGHSEFNIDDDIWTYGLHDFIERGKSERIPDNTKCQDFISEKKLKEKKKRLERKN